MFLMPIQPPIRFRSSTSLSVLHENSSALQTPCDHTLLLHPQRLRFLHLRLLRPRIHHPRIPRDRSAPFAKTLVHAHAAPARQDTAESGVAQELRARLADANDARGALHTSHRHRRHHGCLGSNRKRRVADYQDTKSPELHPGQMQEERL